MEEQTIETLKKSPFNKMRMCVFPKHYDYNHNKPWITHCSIQRVDINKTAENTNEWREKYKKPIIIDECAYEGNIDFGWGNLTGEEMTHRFWEGAVRGGYVGHGETYWNPKEVLWWSKGGTMCGKSPDRIAFLRGILEESPISGINPISIEPGSWDLPCGGVPSEYYLLYFGFSQPLFRTFHLPEGTDYKIDIIDTWIMTIQELKGTYAGKFKIDLPGTVSNALNNKNRGRQ